MKEIGVTANEFYTNAELLATGTLEIHQKYGIDVPVLDYDVYHIEAAAIGQEMKYSATGMSLQISHKHIQVAEENSYERRDAKRGR